MSNESDLDRSLNFGTRTLRGMRPLKAGSVVMVGVVLLLTGLVAGALLGHLASVPTASGATEVHLYVSVAYNPFTGLDEYFPANFTVPANVPVIVTITNYDNGTNAVDPAFSVVKGTLGNVETANGQTVSSVPTDQIAHTFTLITGSYDLNVPIPAAQDTTPTVVTFTAVFGTAGTFTWHCMAPCDGAAMTTPGFMTGTVTVISG